MYQRHVNKDSDIRQVFHLLGDNACLQLSKSGVRYR